MKQSIYFLNINFNFVRTGIENAALLRARLFKKHLGVTPIILTTIYNEHLTERKAELHAQHLLPEDVPLVNMYSYFQESDMTLQAPRDVAQNPLWSYEKIANSQDIRVRDAWHYKIQYRVYSASGRLKFINHFNRAGQKVRRDFFDANGYVSKVDMIDAETEKVQATTFYRTDGTICIQKSFGADGELAYIQLMNRQGDVTFQAYSEQELILYWLQLIFTKDETHVCIVDRANPYYAILTKLAYKHVKLICLFHSSHLKTGADYQNGAFNSNYRDILLDLERPEAVVYLTERQKQHVATRLGTFSNQHVIPHAIETMPQVVNFANRKPYSVVYLGRFAEEKQLVEAIDIFADVVKQLPEATFTLYGQGDQRQKMLERIHTHQLQQHVTVSPYIHQVADAYNNAQVGMLTSKVEGFSLFTLECLAHGVPVVSYDIDYGPSDMIESGKNGALCTLGDKADMTKRLVQLLTDQQQLAKMSEYAYDTAQRFYGEEVIKKWRTLLEEVTTK